MLSLELLLVLLASLINLKLFIMRKKIVAGNWKMNNTFEEADELLADIFENLEEGKPNDVDVIICPPYTYLEISTDIADEGDFSIGAQNVSENSFGAYTGEISAPMLNSMGVEYCIIGHSERRKYFNESNELLAKKVNALLDSNMRPIFCCGELLDDRNKGNHFDVVKKQIQQALFNLSKDEFINIIIAYEPVWAIGTGLNATPEQAQEMHAFIRSLIAEKYGDDAAQEISILYGGSCKPSNAKKLFENPDVDGGLIGGASLNADDFLSIIKSF